MLDFLRAGAAVRGEVAGSGLGPVNTRPAQAQRNESFGLSQCAKWQMRAVGHSAMMLLRGAPGLIAATPTNRPERFFYSPLTPAQAHNLGTRRTHRGCAIGRRSVSEGSGETLELPAH